MKAIIQRVTKASVSVGDEQISCIGKGICVLLGISRNDTQNEVKYMVRKILSLRIFEDENGKHWEKNVVEKNYQILCVSQFTLSCILKGNKPDFHDAMTAELSQPLYLSFLEQMRAAYNPDSVKDGKFQAFMQVHIQNDGPVTIPLESPKVQANTKVKGPRGKFVGKKEDESDIAPTSSDCKEEQAAQ